MFKAIISIGGRLVRFIRPAASAGGKSTRVGTFISKSFGSLKSKLSTVTTATRSRYGMFASKAEASWIGRQWMKLPPGARGFTKDLAVGLGIGALADTLLGAGKDGEGSEGFDPASEIARRALESNGHMTMINNYERMNLSLGDALSTPSTENIKALIGRSINSASLLMTGAPLGDIAMAMDSLTDRERLVAITNLMAVAKSFALSSEMPNVFLLYIQQSAASDMSAPAPTTGFETLLESSASAKEALDAEAAGLSHLYASFYDQMASASAKDYFSQASSVMDVSDLITRSNDTSMSSEFLLSKLATDDLVGFNSTWWTRFITEEGDDEWTALQAINRNGRVSDAYQDFLYSAAVGTDSLSRNY